MRLKVRLQRICSPLITWAFAGAFLERFCYGLSLNLDGLHSDSNDSKI